MYVNYRQQLPTLRLLLVLDRRMDYFRHNLGIKHQQKTIPSHTCSAGFKVSTIKLWAVEERNNLNRSPSSFSQVNWRNILRFLKTKHSLPSPFVVLSNHSVYVVFLDPHQGIDDFAYF